MFALSSHQRAIMTPDHASSSPLAIDTQTIPLQSPSSSSASNNAAISLEPYLICCIQVLHALTQRLQLKHRVFTTACIILRRIYHSHTLQQKLPVYYVSASLLVATKVNDVVRHIHDYVHAMKAQVGEIITADQLCQAEMDIVDILQFDLTFYDPFRLLAQYAHDTEQTVCLDAAWRFLNDMHNTSLIIQYAPYQLAIASFHMAAVLHGFNTSSWLAALQIPETMINSITKELMNFYHRIEHDTHSIATWSELITFVKSG